MDINSDIESLKDQISKSLEYRAEALRQRNHDWAVLNMKCHFLDNLDLGLIQWRLGVNPISYLSRALHQIQDDWKVLRDIDAGKNIICKLPLNLSVYVASLLNEPHSPLDPNDYPETMAPGIFIGNVLLGADSIENWPRHQDKFPNKKTYALVRATFELYVGLLMGKISAEEGVARGEKYYTRRMDDPYFEQSPVLFGGTHLNNRFVDFRLAAVLKHIGSTVPSIHAWRW